MKRTTFILAISLLCSIVLAAPADEKVHLWKVVLEEDVFTNTLAVLAADGSWPIVYSPQYTNQMDESEEEAHHLFHELASRLTIGLQAYIPQMEAMPTGEFSEIAQILLNARDRLAKVPGYINLVLVDSINRVLGHHLALRLSIQDVDLSVMAPLIEHLQRYKPSMTTFLDVASTELGHPLLDESTIGTMSDVELCRALWPLLEKDTMFMFPRKIQNAGTFSLLGQRDFGILLWRLVFTDYQNNSILPSLVEYREKVEDYSIEDGYPKIKATIGQDLKYPSFGAQVYGITLAGNGVSELLYRIRTGKWEGQLLLDTTHLFNR